MQACNKWFNRATSIHVMGKCFDIKLSVAELNETFMKTVDPWTCTTPGCLSLGLGPGQLCLC